MRLLARLWQRPGRSVLLHARLARRRDSETSSSVSPQSVNLPEQESE